MKKIAVIFCLAALCLNLCGCHLVVTRTDKPEEANADSVCVVLHNTVKGQLATISGSYSFGDDTRATTGVEMADAGTALDTVSFSFQISRDQLEDGEDLKDLQFTVSVTDLDGASSEVAVIALPSQWGDTYEMELTCSDGIYCVMPTK